jgi:hypothetical protein
MVTFAGWTGFTMGVLIGAHALVRLTVAAARARVAGWKAWGELGFGVALVASGVSELGWQAHNAAVQQVIFWLEAAAVMCMLAWWSHILLTRIRPGPAAASARVPRHARPVDQGQR